VNALARPLSGAHVAAVKHNDHLCFSIAEPVRGVPAAAEGSWDRGGAVFAGRRLQGAVPRPGDHHQEADQARFTAG